jgi:deoxyribose-phosphate aldolase
MICDKELLKMVDYTNLGVNASEDELIELCNIAAIRDYAAVCVRRENINTIFEHLEYSRAEPPFEVASVVCFPTKVSRTVEEMVRDLKETYGYKIDLSEAKKIQTEDAISRGANEIDAIIDLENLILGNHKAVEDDITGIIGASDGYPVKVILETDYLTDEQIRTACKISEDFGAAYVKTSTGYCGGMGATIRNIHIMANSLSSDGETGIKASGGIKNIEDARAFYFKSQENGERPFRIGTSTDIGDKIKW